MSWYHNTFWPVEACVQQTHLKTFNWVIEIVVSYGALCSTFVSYCNLAIYVLCSPAIVSPVCYTHLLPSLMDLSQAHVRRIEHILAELIMTISFIRFNEEVKASFRPC